jgi:class 3 adenylate cyclase/tetratricopeptide (TPR) repeat protein
VTRRNRPGWGERLRRRPTPPPGAESEREGGDERRQMTVMFADMVGSTAIAEAHEPEVVREVVRRYQAACGEAITARGGYVADYYGDGLMAYFGFPAAREDDARQAVLAGLDVMSRVARVAVEVRRQLGREPADHISTHTGLVLLTQMGAPDRPERDAVVGATPNQAARIQSVAPAGSVAISDATLEIVRGYFEVEALGRPEMKGVAGQVEVFRVVRPTEAAGRIQAAGRALTPLVGRRHELRSLRDDWASLAPQGSGRSRIVLLVGEAGIGKSRVAAEILRDVIPGGNALFVAMCAPDHADRPFFPVIRLLEQQFGFEPEDDDQERAQKLRRGCEDAGLAPEAVPALGALVGVPAGPGAALEMDPVAIRRLTFRTLVDLVLATAQHQRTLFLIEDLQWADQSTLELIDQLSRTAPGGGLLLLATARPEFRPPWSGSCCSTVTIERLPPDDHRRLIQRLAELHPLPERVADMIAERSDGNPLFTEELARAFGADAPRPESIDAIPRTIRDLLTARLDGLNEHKRLAQMAATIGRDVDVELLRAVVPLHRRQVDAGLAVLVQQGILEELVSPGGPVTHRFVHALVRDAAYDSQEKLHDRRAAHRAVARALAARPHPDAGLAARHFDAAGEADEAVRHYVLAATAAQQAAAHVEAIRLLDRALALAGSLPPSSARDVHEVRIRILRGLSTVSLQGYAAPAAADDYRRALELSEGFTDQAEMFTAAMGIWSFYIVEGDFCAAGEALQRMKGMDQPEVEAELLARAIQRFFEGRFGESRELLEAAVHVFASRPPDAVVSPHWKLPNDPLATTLTHLGVLLWLAGELDDADATLRKACSRAGELPYPAGPFSQAHAMSYTSWVANLHGHFSEGLELQERILEISQRHGFVFWTATSVCGVALSQALLGDSGAVDSLASGIASWRSLGAEVFLPCMQTHLAELRLGRGEADQALEEVEGALGAAEARGERFFVAESRRVRAAILRHLGAAPPEVRAELEASRRTASEQGARMFELRALVDLVALDDPDHRDADLRQLRRLLDELPAVARPSEDHRRAHALAGRPRASRRP